jgi:hypothetical protein
MSPSVVIEKLDMSKVGKETKKEKAAEEVIVKARARLSDILEEPDHEQSSPRFSLNSVDQDLFAESGSDALNDLESESSDGSSQPGKKSKKNMGKKSKLSERIQRSSQGRSRNRSRSTSSRRRSRSTSSRRRSRSTSSRRRSRSTSSRRRSRFHCY